MPFLRDFLKKKGGLIKFKFRGKSTKIQFKFKMRDTIINIYCLLHHNFSCMCSPGFTGNNCETNIDDCKNVECQNGGSCVVSVKPSKHK